MSAMLQQAIDEVDPERYQAIVLVYGLCNNGIRGLHAPLPMAVARAHDCITLLLGSHQRYEEMFNDHPGTYYRSPGWIERASDDLTNPDSTTRQIGMGTYEEYVQKYGKENADYLYQMLGDKLRHYNRVCYIKPEFSCPSEEHLQHAKRLADERQWETSIIPGSCELILKLMNGDWDEEAILEIAPGEVITPVYDHRVVTASIPQGSVKDKEEIS